jgi:hypothetical protein
LLKILLHIYEKLDHRFLKGHLFRRKLAEIAENWRKSPKIGGNRQKLVEIVIITLTPDRLVIVDCIPYYTFVAELKLSQRKLAFSRHTVSTISASTER